MTRPHQAKTYLEEFVLEPVEDVCDRPMSLAARAQWQCLCNCKRASDAIQRCEDRTELVSEVAVASDQLVKALTHVALPPLESLVDDAERDPVVVGRLGSALRPPALQYVVGLTPGRQGLRSCLRITKRNCGPGQQRCEASPQV